MSRKLNYGSNKETVIAPPCFDSRVIVRFVFHSIIELRISLFDGHYGGMRENNFKSITWDWTKQKMWFGNTKEYITPYHVIADNNSSV